MTQTLSRLRRRAHLILLLALPTLFSLPSAYGQQLLDEAFDYATGPLITVGSATWAGGAGLIDVTAGTLSYPGYSTGTGNQLHLDVSEGTEQVTRDYPEQTSGSVYASFLVHAEAGLSGVLEGAIFALNGTPNFGRVSILGDGGDGSGGFHFCVTKDNKSTDCTSTLYPAQTTYLVVVAYAFNPGVKDDEAKLWINPSTLPGSGLEPTPDVVDDSGNDATVLGEAAFEQLGDLPAMQVDELRISTAWGDVSLPVALTSFHAATDGADVLLTWATASEANNAGFEVQHRRGAGGPWAPLAFREGVGTTSEAHAYRFRAAGLEPGRHHFRLKQVNYDGSFSYSAVLETSVALPDAFRLSAPYPNPFTTETAFTLAVDRAGAVRVAAYDVLGREVALLHDGALEANEAHRFTLDASGLPSGLYLIRATGERLNATQLVSLAR